MGENKTTVDQSRTTIKVVVVPPEETTKENIEGLREDIKKQLKVQEQIARVGFGTYLRNHDITSFPDGTFSPELQKIICDGAERYPFTLRPTEITGIDDCNTWLDNHPIPTGFDSEEPYEDFRDDLFNLEIVTRYRLKMDTMLEYGHSNNDVKQIESIGNTGHISVASTPEEILTQETELSPEVFDRLKETAIDYFKYRHIWLNPKHTRGLEDEIFDINIISFFKRKGGTGGTGGTGDRVERELLDELTRFASDYDAR